MKAYLILSILLATILFFPSSILARELAAGQGTKPVTRPTDPNRAPCKSKNGSPYNCDIPPKSGSKSCYTKSGHQYNCDTPKPAVPKPCSKYSKKCPPSGS